MVRSLKTNRILWLITALLALVAALTGTISPRMYERVVSDEIMPGVLSQDLFTIPAALIILFLAVRAKENNTKGQIVILGLVAYLWYAYGIYVIEQLYTVLYLLYMAIFGLSFYTMVYGVATIHPQTRQTVELPPPIRMGSVGFSLLSPVMFYPLWISALVPLMQSGRKLEHLYSIYILDLCFIMPAFVIIAIQTTRSQGLGLLLAPAMYVLGVTLLFPVGVGELLKPRYGLPVDTGGLALFMGLSAMFLILALVYLRNLRVKGHSEEDE
jgi:hypothetical protein